MCEALLTNHAAICLVRLAATWSHKTGTIRNETFLTLYHKTEKHDFMYTRDKLLWKPFIRVSIEILYVSRLFKKYITQTFKTFVQHEGQILTNPGWACLLCLKALLWNRHTTQQLLCHSQALKGMHCPYTARTLTPARLETLLSCVVSGVRSQTQWSQSPPILCVIVGNNFDKLPQGWIQSCQSNWFKFRF